MNGPITIESITDEETGTRRLDLWTYDCAGSGSYGDNARGTAYESTYLSDTDGDGLCAEIAVYPVEYEDGSFGVDERSIIGDAVLEDGVWRPGDDAEITYDYGTALAYETLEDAQKDTERVGSQDYSYAIYLRRIAR